MLLANSILGMQSFTFVGEYDGNSRCKDLQSAGYEASEAHNEIGNCTDKLGYEMNFFNIFCVDHKIGSEGLAKKILEFAYLEKMAGMGEIIKVYITHMLERLHSLDNAFLRYYDSHYVWFSPGCTSEDAYAFDPDKMSILICAKNAACAVSGLLLLLEQQRCEQRVIADLSRFCKDLDMLGKD